MLSSCHPNEKPASGPTPLPTGAALAALPPDGGPTFNRLVFEQSPYLLQHARNPVDWYPWGDAAFEKARRENKPIFLSIGYSTCHWCHVMEHESFESDTIAALLNRDFIPIKVDREERPDVDAVYMTYVQATTGGGGWPMSVWLTPELKPILGGTYFPPDDRYGRPGFAAILQQVAKAWSENRERIVSSSDNVLARLREHTSSTNDAVPLAPDILDAAYAQLKSTYEPDFGGFGDAPKFPRPAAPNFMLRYYNSNHRPPAPHRAEGSGAGALAMTTFTLRKMAEGGMYDQLGGGFHRYSVDARWHVPHFEKMLYDQGQLVCTYLDAYQLTHDPFLADVVRGTLGYILRDMTGPHGEWFSAEDADSPLPENPAKQSEGAFYVWEHPQITAALAPESAAIFNFHYGIQPNGNVISDPHGEFPRKNVLMVFHTLDDTAQQFGKTPQEIETNLATARATLLQLRNQRPRPHRDDKTITAWNGLMLSGFARAYQVLDDPAYRDAALRAAAFLRKELVDPKSGNLLRRYRAGKAGIDAYAEDYAFLIQGLLDLYEAAFNIEHLEWAITLQEKQNARFWDSEHGGYFRTAGNDPSVLLRMKEDYDGAEPAANSIAALNLLRLAHMTNRPEFLDRADKLFAAFSARLQATPHAMPQLLAAFDYRLAKPRQIVIAGQPGAADTAALLRAVHARFIPNKVLLLADGAAGQKFLAQHNALFTTLAPQHNQATAYICENFTCRLPTPSPAKVTAILDEPL